MSEQIIRNNDDLRKLLFSVFRASSTKEVIEATQILKAHCKAEESIPQFLEFLCKDKEVEIRQLSAILLKRNIAAHSLNMKPDDRAILRKALLEHYFVDPSGAVQRSLAVLIAHIAKSGFEHEDAWTDLLVVISEQTKADKEEKTRVLGFSLLTTLLEIAGEYLNAFYEELFKFFYESIKDTSSVIKKQTLLCVLNMFTSVTQTNLIDAFQEIYPSLLEALYLSIVDNDEDIIENALIMLQDLTEGKSVLFGVEELGKLIELFCLPNVLTSKSISAMLREQMIGVMYNMVTNYKSAIVKNSNMSKKIVELAFTLACDKEKDIDAEKEPVQKIALEFIRQIATILPKKKHYPIYKDYFTKMFQSEDTNIVEAGFLVLANLAEGCAEYMKRELPDPLMKVYIQTGIKHQSFDIRKATFYCLNYFSQFLLPDILSFHHIIIPVLIENMNERDNDLLHHCILSLEIFCEEMDESIIKYLPTLVPKLYEILERNDNTLAIKRHCILALSSCAESAQGKFAEYAVKLLPSLSKLLEITQPEYIDLRSVATSCIGTILGHCITENREIYTNYIEPLIPYVSYGIQNIDNTILKEFSFQFFYNLASFLGTEFKPYMNDIVKMAAQVIESAKVYSTNEKFNPISALEDDSDEENPDGVTVNHNVVEELSAAIHCLGETAMACPVDYEPYYKETLQMLETFSDHFHANLRIQVVVCYKNLLYALVKAENNNKFPKYQKGIENMVKFSPNVEDYLFITFYEKILTIIENDEHIDVARGAIEVIDEIAKELGPAGVYFKLEQITESLIAALQNETISQKHAFEDDEEVEGEMYTAITELLETLSKVCGSGFLECFEHVFPHLLKYLKDDKTEDDISQTIGLFAQCLKFMPKLAASKGAEIIRGCFAVIEYGDEYINRNAAFCIAMICEYAKELIASETKPILEKLRVIYDNSAFQDTKDNTVAAIARMIYSVPQSVPLDVVIGPVLQAIPFTGDDKENRTVLKMVVFLFENYPNVLNGHEEKCLEFILTCFKRRKEYKVKDEQVLKGCGRILKKVSENEQGQKFLETFASQMSQEDVGLLSSLIKDS